MLRFCLELSVYSINFIRDIVASKTTLRLREINGKKIVMILHEDPMSAFANGLMHSMVTIHADSLLARLGQRRGTRP